MRIGLLGGTFDPVHYGHLILAEQSREQARLDAVWFLPASVPPHKSAACLTPAARRVDMLQLAIGGNENFGICTHEIDRPGVNFTYQTLEALRAQHPRMSFYFLLGGDSLADLPHWREPARICELAELVVARRAGAAEPDWPRLAGLATEERLRRFQALQVQMPLIDISSSDIRQRVAAGRSIRYLTPRAVEMYIQTQGLYRNTGTAVPQ